MFMEVIVIGGGDVIETVIVDDRQPNKSDTTTS
jgi:hypothetical protein